MKLNSRSNRRAVAPVIATLLMIAVAVAMSVIIFMWSQGFLSQTSSATGGQQGSQNQAAQSSISIETATFVDGASATSCTGPCTVTLIVRNVGAVGVNLGSLQISGISSNSGFKESLLVPALTQVSGTAASIAGSTTGSGSTSDSTVWFASASPSLANILSKGSAVSITIYYSSGPVASTSILSGDVINIKVTTNVGTFAQAQFTAP